jgi:hypothetical protein
MAAKYLFFNTGSNDAMSMPVDNLRGISTTADDTVELAFDDINNYATGVTVVSLTVNTGKEKDVQKAVSEAIAFGKDQFLIIADSNSSDFIHSDITAVSVNNSVNFNEDVKKGADRWVHEEFFLQRPALNAAIATSEDAANTLIHNVANKNFELLGTNMTTALCTFNHEYGGIELTTATADNDSCIILPHLDTNQSALGVAGMFDSQNEVEFATSITTGGTITTYSFTAGLKLTNDPVYATDDDQAYFLFCTDDDLGALTTNANLHFVYSVGGTDYISDLGIAVSASQTLNLKIAIDSDRKVSAFVNGSQYSLTSATTAGGVATGGGTVKSSALTDNAALIPYIGCQAHAGSAARDLFVHYEKISRKVN